MAKRKTDTELQDEIHQRSKTMRDFLKKSHLIHQEAILIGLDREHRQEHISVMRRVIEFQRMAIAESKKIIRLENILLRRELKTIKSQRIDMEENESRITQ